MRLIGGYLVCLLPLATWYTNTLPWTGALEQLWPVHMRAHYAATYPDRWPTPSGPSELLARWLPTLLGLGATLFTVARNRVLAHPPSETISATRGLLFLPLCYLLGCLILFQNAYAIIGHLWLAWVGIALVPGLLPSRYRFVGTTALVLAAIVQGMEIAHAVKDELRWESRPQTLPNGQRLWFTPGESKRFGRLEQILSEHAHEPLVVFLTGGGIHHFHGTRHIGRHWWFLPEFIRPWESEAAFRDIRQHRLLLVGDLGQTSALNPETHTLALWLPLPPSLAESLLPYLRNPVQLDGVGTLLQIER